jgi:hypothetical protein
MGWLGRQVGHVKKAVKADVTKGAAKPAGAGQARPKGPASKASAGRQAGANSSAATRPSPASKPAAETSSQPNAGTAIEKVIYREDKVEEAELPDRPGVILRRTIIDEVVVETETKSTEEKQS